jgi:hypothetical protein
VNHGDPRFGRGPAGKAGEGHKRRQGRAPEAVPDRQPESICLIHAIQHNPPLIKDCDKKIATALNSTRRNTFAIIFWGERSSWAHLDTATDIPLFRQLR